MPRGSFCSSAVAVIFDPLKAGKITPFPNNFWTKDDPSTPTGIRLNLVSGLVPPNHSTYLGFNQLNAQLNELDGFGTIAGLVFRFTGAVDKSVYGIDADQTGVPQSPLVLVDIDTASPQHGKQRTAQLEYHEDSSSFVLIARPLVPLRPKTTYAAMLRSDVKTGAGDCLAASAAMQEVLLGKAAGPGYDRLAPHVPDAIKMLRNLGAIDEVADIAALTVFTTQSIHEEMLAIAKDIDAYDSQTGYAITTYQDDGPFGPQGPTVAHMIKGTFKAIRYTGPDGTISFENGAPKRQGFDELKFELYLPVETAELKPPFPIAIFQHGLAGSTEEIKNEGRKLSTIGVATIAIDAPCHGSRLGLPPSFDFMSVPNMFGVDVLSPEIFDTVKMKDNFRQGYADLLQLARLVTRGQGLDLLPAGNPDGSPEIKASEVLLVGHSLGAILGSGFFSLDARSKISAMGCGGAGLTDIILYSQDFSVVAGLMQPAGASFFEVEAMFPMMQTVFERGDPGNFLGALQREPLGPPASSSFKHVLLQAIINDTRIPNRVNDTWARAAGVPLLTPPLWKVAGMGAPQAMPAQGNGNQGSSAGYFHIDWIEEGKMSKHDGVFDELVPRTQWLHWYSTYLETGTPEIIDPYKELGMKP